MAKKEIAVKKYVVKLSAEERDRLGAMVRAGKNSAQCSAPGSLDKRLAYAARLKDWSCQATRASLGLRWPFFSISHSAL